jgi:ABC-type dipeptide/oligopeptide/nickel transport system permease subunit
VLAITLSSTARLTNAAGAVLNLFASLPGLLLSVALIAVAAGSNTVVAIAVALPFIPGCWHRLLNAGCRYRAAPFTAAALAIGTPERQIDAQLAASLVAPAAAELSLLAARALAAFALLSFLGFGLPNAASIGGLIAQAPAAHAWWLAVFPAGALALICASLTLLARGLRTLGPRPSDG